MNITINYFGENQMSVQPDEEFTTDIANILVNQFNCHLTQFSQRQFGYSGGTIFEPIQDMKYFGFIETYVSNAKQVKEIVNFLHDKYGGQLITVENKYTITDDSFIQS